MTDNIRPDCCDLCKLVDATKEHSACPVMTKRCKGSSCAECVKCYTYRPKVTFESALRIYSERTTGRNGPSGAEKGQGRGNTRSSATKGLDSFGKGAA